MIKDKENMAEVSISPEKAAFIAWAEQAPKRCLFFFDTEIRYEGFSSPFEVLTWIRHIMPEKKEVLELLTKQALEAWEIKYQESLPESRKKV